MAIEQDVLPPGVKPTDTRLPEGTFLHRAQRYREQNVEPPQTNGSVWMRRKDYEQRLGKEVEIYGEIVGYEDPRDEGLLMLPSVYVYLPVTT